MLRLIQLPHTILYVHFLCSSSIPYGHLSKEKEPKETTLRSPGLRLPCVSRDNWQTLRESNKCKPLAPWIPLYLAEYT